MQGYHRRMLLFSHYILSVCTLTNDILCDSLIKVALARHILWEYTLFLLKSMLTSHSSSNFWRTHLFMYVCTHHFLFYSMSCSILLSFLILMLKLFLIWPVEVPSRWLLCFLTCSRHSLSPSLLSVTTRCSGLILSLPQMRYQPFL